MKDTVLITGGADLSDPMSPMNFYPMGTLSESSIALPTKSTAKAQARPIT
jgi:hypothetical protein